MQFSATRIKGIIFSAARVTISAGKWILTTGFWSDLGAWVDNANWID